MDDLELLRDYAANQSEAAFSALVERHLNLVHSSARRQVQDNHLAEEITQAVFLILSRKAGSIRPGTILSGWLMRTTRFTAANALRRIRNRQQFEKDAMSTAAESPSSDSVWERIGPLLDEGLAGLRDKERDAVALRFFEKKSFREVGDALGMTEDNAQKRVSRALDKLRLFFKKCGYTVPVVALTGALSANAVHAAPEALAASVRASVLAHGGMGTAASQALCETTMEVMARARLQTVAYRIAAVFPIVGLLYFGLPRGVFPQRHAAAPQTTAASSAGSPPLPATAPLLAAAETFGQPGAHRFAFRVIDATNRAPLAGAKLTLNEITEFPNRSTNVFTTDRNGFGLLPPPVAEVKNWNYRIEIFLDGYVPKYVSWGAGQGDDFGEFPTEYTSTLARGVSIGGVVLDEQAQPISGARVLFSVSGSSPGGSRDRERLTMMGEYHEEFTDAAGRWTCNHVPEQFGMITWKLIHREHQDITYGTSAPEAGESIGPERLPKADYLTGRAVMKMKRGMVVAGLVEDETGRPIPGARITLGREFRRPEGNLTTDAEGRFRFLNGREKETWLTVQAEGFTPEDRKVMPNADLEEQRFTLSKGGMLQGRVLDESGEAIPNATVAVSSDGTGRERFEWRTKSRADGRFEWPNAPLKPTRFSVGASGYDSKSGLEFAANAAEHIVTLSRNTRQRLRLTARAFDAETHQPIESFKVLVAESQEPLNGSHSSIMVGFSRPESKGDGRNGNGTATISSYTTRFFAEVQAEGYTPMRLTNVNSGQGVMTLDFAMKKGEPVRGVVRSPEGFPLGDAQVILLAGFNSIQMHHPAQFQVDPAAVAGIAKTDAQGRFSFPRRLEMNKVVVSHALGFADVALDALASSPEIQLQRWGRVEGVLMIGKKPAANETIKLGNFSYRFGGWPGISVMRQTTTDVTGKFVFEGVPHGDRKVSFSPKLKNVKSNPMATSHGEFVEVIAGETVHVTLGGSGRTVIGKVSVGGIKAPVDWQQDVHTLTSRMDFPPEAVVPVRGDFASTEEFTRALGAYAEKGRPYWVSDVGRAAQRAQREYALIFEPDGSFRAHDIAPGTYELTVTPMEPPRPIATSGGGTVYPASGIIPIGTVKVEITVPVADINAADTPVDVGELILKPASP